MSCGNPCIRQDSDGVHYVWAVYDLENNSMYEL